MNCCGKGGGLAYPQMSFWHVCRTCLESWESRAGQHKRSMQTGGFDWNSCCGVDLTFSSARVDCIGTRCSSKRPKKIYISLHRTLLRRDENYQEDLTISCCLLDYVSTIDTGCSLVLIHFRNVNSLVNSVQISDGSEYDTELEANDPYSDALGLLIVTNTSFMMNLPSPGGSIPCMPPPL